MLYRAAGLHVWWRPLKALRLVALVWMTNLFNSASMSTHNCFHFYGLLLDHMPFTGSITCRLQGSSQCEKHRRSDITGTQ